MDAHVLGTACISNLLMTTFTKSCQCGVEFYVAAVLQITLPSYKPMDAIQIVPLPYTALVKVAHMQREARL